MQVCFFVLTAIFWTYTVYFLVKSTTLDTIKNVGELCLCIFTSVTFFIIGLICYLVAINAKETVQPVNYYY